MMNRSVFSCFQWLSLFVLTLCTVTAIADDRLKDIDDYINGSLEDWRLPGIAVAVVHNGETIFADGFGAKELGKPDQIDKNTLFQVGSTSKAFAAAAVAILVDEGKLSWNDRVVDHLPWFKADNPDIAAKATVQDLLTHTTGLRDALYPAVAIMNSDQVSRKIADLKPVLSYGDYRYCNLGYGLIEHVVEKASGMDWHDFVQQRIFAPLEMQDSQTSPYAIWNDEHVAPVFFGSAPAGDVGIANAANHNVAMPHGRNERGETRVLAWQSYDNMAPAGSVVSSVADMANWLKVLLNDGRFQGQQLLTVETARYLSSSLVEIPKGYFLFADSPAAHYGLGWDIQQFQGRRLVYHGGGILGFPALAAFFPDQDLGIVVLANGNTLTPYYPHQEVVAWVAERLLGLDSRDWHGEILAATNQAWDEFVEKKQTALAARKLDTQPTLSLQSYAGRYQAQLPGAATVEHIDGQLRFQIKGEGAFSGRLQHWQDDQFMLHMDGGDAARFSTILVSFVIDENTGKVTDLDVGPVGSFKRID